MSPFPQPQQKMKVIILTIVVILSVVYSNATSASEKCQKLTDMASRFLSKLEEVLPPQEFAFIRGMAPAIFEFDMFNSTVRDDLLCKIAAVKNLHELFDALPRIYFTARGYEPFSKAYERLQQDIASYLGGYTNLERILNLAKDVDDWANQQNPGKTLRERTDLATLTEFLKMLQVKFGSRALSYLVGVKNGDFLVTDPEELAGKFYEDDRPDAIQEYTDLTYNEAVRLTMFLRGDAVARSWDGIWDLFALAVEGINLVGDMGLLTLKP